MSRPAVRPLCLALATALAIAGLGACSTATDRADPTQAQVPTDADAVAKTAPQPAVIRGEREAGESGQDRAVRRSEPAPAAAAQEALVDAVAPYPPQARPPVAPPPPPAARPAHALDAASASSRETYAHIEDSPLRLAAEHPVSTFSIDVDTGSYANLRRMLEAGQLPPPDAVRTEELINYFDYGYAPPRTSEQPFSVATEIAPAPWNPRRHLLLVGIKGYEVAPEALPASNLVFLVDTSGSMASPDKLPLLRDALSLLAAQLRPQDRVAIVAYAGSAGLVLPSTPGSERGTILAALEGLHAAGSTNGGAGIELAYDIAARHFIAGGVNRVVLATDGDFNVGTVDLAALKALVAARRQSGIALSTLGVGSGNYNDALAEQLADIGNGNHAYLDGIEEAQRRLVDELSSTLLTIAEDVKVQVEFNPALVAEYRLIGYENRALRREDFANDRVDAGEIGAGHEVTALYEIALAGSGGERLEPLRYGATLARPDTGAMHEIAHLRLRYRLPGDTRSALVEMPLRRGDIAATPGARLRFAAAVAAFADALRGGRGIEAAGRDWSLADVAALAAGVAALDPHGQHAEFVSLVERARELRGEQDVAVIAR